ncbi:anaerobic selenocysteine-containing dehydrogenase [Novosphingobium sp. PhB165]|uniref:molybdopterin-containing oxidoreductase family protein n=1 Tax=Novosphingobium sp. PhB165 TaxID=2485105 RepID=UPI0010CF8C7D|nr:molybdopterin-dependent oxidoreductase [Novosphingobium sp. PhB165]TCM20490.1 anaerobic selenocysteine-containing dehydrogenase [Novosphingobium sp. PhB165]
MQDTSSKRTYCRVCTNQCGMVVELEDDRIVKVRADRDHPLSKGYSCPKGRALGGIHHHPDAITRPMMRKQGVLVEVDWDECLDDIAQRLRAVIDTHGPGAVGVYFGSGLGMDASGYHMVDAFHKALGTAPKFSPLTIDGTAKVLVATLVGGFPGLSPKTDNDDVEMLLYVGVNPMVSHGHNTGMFNPAGPIRAAAKRGEVWTIDPLFTETAKFSTRHIAPYPGKDYAILAWLVREILDGGPMDLAQPVQGLEELRAALAGFDRAKAAAIAGVPEEDLADLLAAIRRKGHVVVETGTGVTMADSANVTQWLAWVLMILTGRMNRKGGAWFHPGFITCYDSFELPVMEHPFTPGAPTMPEVNGLIGDWPCAALPGEIAAGNIRAMMNFGGSLLRSFPDTNLLRRNLETLDLNVTFEIIGNETTALSTHVLPTKDQVERADISFWDTLAGSVSLLYTPPVVAPQGERRSAWWVIAQLMKRAGMRVAPHVPASDLDAGADDAMLASLMPYARAGFDELAREGAITKPLEFPGKWVDDHVERMGGWRLAPGVLVDTWHALLEDDEARIGRAHPLCFISRRQRRKLNAALSFLGSPADIILHPRDAEAYGIVHGDPVRVSTKRGEIVLTANVSDTIRPGVASIPHGHETANVNLLTSTSEVDRTTGMVRYTGIPIEIAPALG